MNIQAHIEKGVYQKDIAERMGVHPKTISRALRRGGAPPGKRPGVRGSILDPFKPMIDQLLREGVWNASVIYRELQSRGYTARTTVLRDYIHPKRPMQQSRATVRFETNPGHQLQNEWGELITCVGGRPRKVYFNVNTLGYSRRFHFWCALRNDAEHTYEGIIRAFEHFGGCTREVLVDNQKAAVITHRIGDAGESLVAEHRLRPVSQGWVSVAAHHETLWRQALQVERRDLSVYEEVARCSL